MKIKPIEVEPITMSIAFTSEQLEQMRNNVEAGGTAEIVITMKVEPEVILR